MHSRHASKQASKKASNRLNPSRRATRLPSFSLFVETRQLRFRVREVKGKKTQTVVAILGSHFAPKKKLRAFTTTTTTTTIFSTG